MVSEEDIPVSSPSSEQAGNKLSEGKEQEDHPHKPDHEGGIKGSRAVTIPIPNTTSQARNRKQTMRSTVPPLQKGG